MTRHLLVVGDQLIHEHVGQAAGDGWARGSGWGPGARQESPGGIVLLSDLIAAICDGLDVRVQAALGEAATDPEGGAVQRISRVMHCWTPRPRVAGGADQVWRIDRSFVVENAGAVHGAPPSIGATRPPDLLVVDDAGLSGGDARESWLPGFMQAELPDSAEIIFNTGRPIGDGLLWQTLLRDHSEQLTVIVPVRSLRARHAAISQQLSWDRTIEDLDRELTRGASFVDLGGVRRLIVYFPAAGAAVYTQAPGRGLELLRFVYHPEDLEGAWYARRPGWTLGAMAILTAAVATHVLAPQSYPVFVALARALHAIRAGHERGGGEIKARDARAALASFRPGLDESVLRKLLLPAPEVPAAALPEGQFRAAFPRRLLGSAGVRPDAAGGRAAREHVSDLLQDVTGRGYEYVAAMATQVVLQGVGPALAAAPKARYGALTTVDREEIERINEIRRLMMTYQASESDRKPLSIAVFGPPGSGKSFAIKQLARDLFGGSQEVFEFNLSQFGSRSELHEAFNQVRDATVRGRIPLVFWDEFDTGGLAWLKEFLAPMQDAEYRSAGYVHPFGKAIFVFAGGTAADFEAFGRSGAPGSTGEQFRQSKGPDFISRLRGYVNIKGPNPISRSRGAGASARDEDVAHLIRRGIILRSIIERSRPELIEPGTRRALVSPGVIRAFLRVRTYLHGARSLEAVVTMSNLSGASRFGISELPSSDLLRLHVTPDFIGLAREGELEETTTEYLAEATHWAWMQGRVAEGWTFGPAVSGEQKTHPLLVEYLSLAEADRERNRHSARVTLAKLHASGYQVVPAQVHTAPGDEVRPSEAERQAMAAVEHDIWLRDRLLHGYEFSERRDERLRLHPAVRPFDDLPAADKQVTQAIVDNALQTLLQGGYRLVRATVDPGRVSVGVTGHRDLDDPRRVTADVVKALNDIMVSFGNRPLTIVCALAEGSDRLVAEAGLALPAAELVAVLPACREEYAAEFGKAGSPSRLHLDSLLARAVEVVEATVTQATREEGYEAAGKAILDRCDVLLAVWDGEAARGKGGTAEVVALAREMGRPVVIVRTGGCGER